MSYTNFEAVRFVDAYFRVSSCQSAAIATSDFFLSLPLSPLPLIRHTIYMWDLRGNADGSICACIQISHLDQTSTTPIVVALLWSRASSRRKPLINLRQDAFISRAIRVRPGHVAKRTGRKVVTSADIHLWKLHLLPCFGLTSSGLSHERPVTGREMPARQIAREPSDEND